MDACVCVSSEAARRRRGAGLAGRSRALLVASSPLPVPTLRASVCVRLEITHCQSGPLAVATARAPIYKRISKVAERSPAHALSDRYLPPRSRQEPAQRCGY